MPVQRRRPPHVRATARATVPFQLSGLVAALPGAAAVVRADPADGTWGVLTANPAWDALADATGSGALAALYDNDWLAACVERCEAPQTRTAVPLARGDSIGFWDVSQAALALPDGMAVLLTARDVSAHVHARHEAERRHRDVQEALERRLAQLYATYDAAPAGLCLLDAEMHVIAMNDRLAVLTGQPAPAFLGRTLREIAPALADLADPIFRLVRATGLPVDSVEVAYPCAGGAVQTWLANFHPVRAEGANPGEVAGISVSVVEITERKRAEEALCDSERQLRAAVEAGKLLQREADHRIKNSLQLIAHVLGMQRARVSNEAAAEALDGAMARVMAVAETHRALHRSVDLQTIDLSGMLADLVANAALLNPAVTMRCDLSETLTLDAERAIPLGLVVSELLTNAMKYAYPGGLPGIVGVSARGAGEEVEITVVDYGQGIAPSQTAPRNGLGRTIIRGLAARVGATVVIDSAPDRGTRASLRLHR